MPYERARKMEYKVEYPNLLCELYYGLYIIFHLLGHDACADWPHYGRLKSLELTFCNAWLRFCFWAWCAPAAVTETTRLGSASHYSCIFFTATNSECSSSHHHNSPPGELNIRQPLIAGEFQPLSGFCAQCRIETYAKIICHRK